MDDSHLGSLGSDQDEKKQCKDDLLVDLVEEESILWKRNHPSFKNQLLKEQAWLRIATQLGISSESLNIVCMNSQFPNPSVEPIQRNVKSTKDSSDR